MLLTLMALTILLRTPAGQDGPVRTAPVIEAAPHFAAAPPARPVDPAQMRADDCRASINRQPAETEQACRTRVNRAAFDRALEEAEPEENPWALLERAGLPAADPGEGNYSRSAPPAVDGGVPAWALADPGAWESSQCGATGDDACRRRARNRLAMARAGVAETPAAPVAPAAPRRQNCRMVMQRSADGFGGSLSRICGDDDAGSQAFLDRLRDNARPAAEPCDRPAPLESQAGWIARCRVLPAR